MKGPSCIYSRSLGVVLAAIFCLICVSAQDRYLIWSVATGDNTTNNGAIAFSPDGSLVASGRSDSNDVNLWRASDGMLVRTLNGRDNDANVIAFSPDGLYLATGTGQGGQGLSLNLWRVSDGERVVGRIPAFNNGTISVSFTPDSQYLAAAGFHATNYLVFHVPDMTQVASVPNFDPDLGYNVRANAVAYSPDGRIIAVGDNNSIKLRNAADGSLIRKINTNAPNTMKTVSLAFSHNGKYIAGGVWVIDPTYGNCVDCSVKIFRAESGELVRSLTNGTGIADAKIGFSPDDQTIGAGFADDGSTYGGSLQFWQVSTGATLRRTTRAFWVQDFAYSQVDNRFAFFGADGIVAVGKAPTINGSR